MVSLDGRSAYDSISRAAFLTKTQEVAPSLLPYVRAFYGHRSTYYWWDDAGTRHAIHQGEGCEQGDALAPALFALGQHDALAAADRCLQPGDQLAAFLDDLYVITTPDRAREAFDTVARAVEGHAGIASNLGKARVYNRAGGAAPPGVAALGPEVWRGGFLALGTPIGDPAFVQAAATARLDAERGLLAELLQLPDLQSAWLLLTYCAAPRAQHLLRTLPPSMSAPYARAHDAAIWHTLQNMLGEDTEAALAPARDLAFLPARLGGLGLFYAEHLAPAAYWAAWADALPVLQQRRPQAAGQCAADLLQGLAGPTACLREAAHAATDLTAQGWAACPAWAALCAPPSAAPRLEDPEPCLWLPGWQPRSLLLHPSANASCCRHSRPATRQFSGPNQGHRQQPGFTPSQQTLLQLWRRTSCTLPFDAACACACLCSKRIAVPAPRPGDAG